jgi:hypothetical protein
MPSRSHANARIPPEPSWAWYSAALAAKDLGVGGGLGMGQVRPDVLKAKKATLLYQCHMLLVCELLNTNTETSMGQSLVAKHGPPTYRINMGSPCWVSISQNRHGLRLTYLERPLAMKAAQGVGGICARIPQTKKQKCLSNSMFYITKNRETRRQCARIPQIAAKKTF